MQKKGTVLLSTSLGWPAWAGCDWVELFSEPGTNFFVQSCTAKAESGRQQKKQNIQQKIVSALMKCVKTCLELETSRQRGHGKVEDGIVGRRDELQDDHEADQHRLRIREAKRRVERLQVVEVPEIRIDYSICNVRLKCTRRQAAL